MTVELTEPIRQALQAHPNDPLRMVDPQTNTEYVLIRKEVYERLEQLVGLDPQAAYPLVDETFREGWDDPKMAEYDDYETRKRP
ncbi:MAG TPA: hypothetical protein VG013_41825 [Gemmataceae bacterium]|jgi:hypothetical protein|nr:hypothetical protein [Gemmataceae bacterium]